MSLPAAFSGTLQNATLVFPLKNSKRRALKDRIRQVLMNVIAMYIGVKSMFNYCERSQDHDINIHQLNLIHEFYKKGMLYITY